MCVLYRGLIAVTILALSVSASRSASEDCREAIEKYNRAISELSFSIRRYADCVSSSRGRDDCSSEFSSLQSDQDDFETAVRRYRRECD